MMVNAASGQIAIYHGFQGPNFATASACASSQHALGMALDSISSGLCDVVLAGGSEAVAVADARASLDLITGIYASAQTGQPQPLPIPPDHPLYAGWQPPEHR